MFIENIPKFINPWSIKTSKGYSIFITQPMHRDLPFEILQSIVDPLFVMLSIFQLHSMLN